MDVLTDVLESVCLRSAVQGRLELTAPWGIRLEGGQPGFHVVTRGSAWLAVDGVEQALQLAAGDFVLLAHAQPHALRDSRRTRALPMDHVLEHCECRRGCQPGGVLKYGGGGALTTIVSGCFELEQDRHSPLLAALPPLIHVKADGGTGVQWLESTLQFVASEMAAGQPGAATVVSRLADILFVQAVRAHLSSGDAVASGWLRALTDPQLSKALALMHQDAAGRWTVESLAHAAGMSRSAFAGRFTGVVGEAPLAYLTRLRMRKAARLLRHGTASISDVAALVGYEAGAAFSKAFKRAQGVSPGLYRRSCEVDARPASRRRQLE